MNVEPQVKARTVNGSLITYSHEISMTITIDGEEQDLNAYYSPLLAYDIILGYKFLKSTKCIIKFGKIPQIFQRQLVLRAPGNLNIGADQEVIIWAKIPGNLISGTGLVTTHSKLEHLGLIVAKELVTMDPKKPWIPVRILNALPVPKLIPKGTRLAYVERLGLVDKITELPSTIFKANSESHEKCSRKRAKFQPPEDFVRLFDLSDSTFSDS